MGLQKELQEQKNNSAGPIEDIVEWIRFEGSQTPFHDSVPLNLSALGGQIAMLLDEVHSESSVFPENVLRDGLHRRKFAKLHIKSTQNQGTPNLTSNNTADSIEDDLTVSHGSSEREPLRLFFWAIQNPLLPCDIRARDKMLSTFLSACRDGDVASIARLLRKGQDVHSQQYNSEYHDFCSALHVAAFSSRRCSAEVLLLYGACIDQESGECGWRPLPFSAERGDNFMTRHLLEKKAKMSIGRPKRVRRVNVILPSPKYSPNFTAGIGQQPFMQLVEAARLRSLIYYSTLAPWLVAG